MLIYINLMNISTERPRCRWMDNIKLDIREIYNGIIWAGSIWFRIWTSGGLL
jgi:hypothetical protein